jgi:hypothetical protein
MLTTEKIQQTLTYNNADNFQKNLLTKAANRKKIENAFNVWKNTGSKNHGLTGILEKVFNDLVLGCEVESKEQIIDNEI